MEILRASSRLVEKEIRKNKIILSGERSRQCQPPFKFAPLMQARNLFYDSAVKCNPVVSVRLEVYPTPHPICSAFTGQHSRAPLHQVTPAPLHPKRPPSYDESYQIPRSILFTFFTTSFKLCPPKELLASPRPR